MGDYNAIKPEDEETPMINFFIDKGTSIDDAVLNAIAHIPTEYLPKVVAPGFLQKLADKDFIRIGTLLAQKSYEEGGCPIGGVIIDNETRQIIGKGHNTLGQENDSTTHGETAALRDAGRVARLRGEGPVDFRKTTLFTTLTPCAVCCAQINNRCNFERVVIGDVTNAPSTESILRDGGIQNVQIVEDPKAVALYREYSQKRPDLHYIDWAGHKKWEEAQKAGLVAKPITATAPKPRGRPT
jgi:cytosine/creatinine deaminase